jgi:hypothetical protein
MPNRFIGRMTVTWFHTLPPRAALMPLSQRLRDFAIDPALLSG